MTIMIRKIATARLWRSLQGPDFSDKPFTEIPIDLIRDFIPSSRDKYQLSCFEVDDDACALNVAAAFMLMQESIEQSVAFAAVEKKELCAFSITVDRGGTHHTSVDQRHRSIRVETLDATERLVRTFLGGTLLSYEGKEVKKAFLQSAKTGSFALDRLHAEPASGPFAKNVRLCLKENLISIRGVEVMEAA